MATESLGYKVKQAALGGAASGSVNESIDAGDTRRLLCVRVPDNGAQKIRLRYIYKTTASGFSVRLRRIRDGASSGLVMRSITLSSSSKYDEFNLEYVFSDMSYPPEPGDWVALEVANGGGSAATIDLNASVEVF